MELADPAPLLDVVSVEDEDEPPLGLVVVLGVLEDDEDALPLGGVLGEALDDEELLGEVVLGELDEELEPPLGELGVVTLPEAEPLAEPGRLAVSLVDDPDEDVLEPDGEDGVVAPRELSGPRSQP